MAKALSLTLSLVAGVGALELTKDTWDAAVSGKSVFVKFYAPWCGHCKRIKPDWDKLMTKFENSKTTLIADVDCVGTGKSKCEEVGVKGYPTLKYGDPDDLQDYSGGRDFDALLKFASDLGPMCSPANLDLCDEAKKSQISNFVELGAAKREEMIKDKEAEVEKLEKDFKSFVEGLQKQYEEANNKKEADLEAIKSSGLGLLKAVHNHEKKSKTEL